MSEAAVGNRQLAMGEKGFEDFGACLSLIAYPPSAICFTVTEPVTSVTHRRLAEGVLIRVGVVWSEQGPRMPRSAKHGGLALWHCSFREGTCIQ